MDKSFCFGLLIGAVAGACFVANSNKARTICKKGQEEFKEKLDELMEEKLKSYQSNQGLSQQN